MGKIETIEIENVRVSFRRGLQSRKRKIGASRRSRPRSAYSSYSFYPSHSSIAGLTAGGMGCLNLGGGAMRQKEDAMEWKVTLSDLCYDDTERRAVDETLASGWLTMGPRVAAFEEALSKRLDGVAVVMVSSATAALHLSALALGIGPGDEVIVPSLTFAATANIVRIAGARPVFADIVSLAEPTLDPAHARSLITARTRAMIPVHYAGFACRMAELSAIAVQAARRLAIIEDAAHAVGGFAPDGRPLGTIGDTGAFSFFSNKNLATGEGGAVAARDSALAERLRRLRCHGLTAGTWTRHKGGGGDYDVAEVGLNYRPSEITAALGLAQLSKFDAMQAARRRLYEAYLERLAPLKERVVIPFAGQTAKGGKAPGRPAYHIFPILLPDEPSRDRVAGALRDAGIQTSHHYRPLHQMTAYREGAAPLPITEEFASRELTLPFHPKMTLGNVDLIVGVITRSL